jgi:hypothetical protein
MKPVTLLLGIMFAVASLAEPINPNAQPPDKPLKIMGKVGYGCGPTHGSCCFLVTTKENKTYVIGGYFPDLPDGTSDFLNQAKDGNRQVTVTGQLKRGKFNGYRVFDLDYTMELK